MVSQRLEDLSTVKQRLSRQWNVILSILQNDIPKDIREYLRLYSLMTRERLYRANLKALENIKAEWNFVKRNTERVTDASLQFLQNRWQQLQPRLDSLVQTSFAISTATSTLQLTVQVTPIVLSAMTILATAPMLNALLPEFLFNSTVLFFIMVGISSYAGYSKFKELESRAKLDEQIAVNQKQNTKHSKELKRLEKRLHFLERSLTLSLTKDPANLPPTSNPPLSVKQQPRSKSLRQSTRKQEESILPYRKASPHKR